MTDPVRVEHLAKTYNAESAELAVRAVSDISFRVGRGDSLAIVGPSGCGKSTMLHVLGCLDRPTSGSYYLEGRDVAEMSEDERAAARNRHIGFVFQNFNLLPRMDAVENVELPLLYGGRDRTRERAMHALERVGLSDRAHHLPSELSGGQRQRVALARALVTEPSILLGDEPTGALDSKTGREVLTLMRQLNAEGMTLIMVTHDLAVARSMKRALLMRDGRLELDATSAEVADRMLADAGGGIEAHS